MKARPALLRNWRRRLAAALLLTAALAGCSTLPDLRADAGVAEALAMRERFAALARAGATVWPLDPARSNIRIYVFRAGAAARVGHNHVLTAPRFAGFLAWPADGNAASAQFELDFALADLLIDPPGSRDGLGRAFASTVPPEAIAAARANMLGEDNLQAARYPRLRVRSLQVTGEAPKLMARVAVELHGQTREQWVALNVTGLPAASWRADGRLVLRQSDFGVRPFSVLGGLIAVQDEVMIEFDLAGSAGAP